jgi:hypothetical protein
VEELLQSIREWIAGFDRDFDALKLRLEKDLRKVEASVLRRVLADILPLLKVEDGVIKNTVSNMAKANVLDRVFLEIQQDELKPIIQAFSEALLSISGRNAEYYLMTGFDTAKVNAIAKDTTLLRSVVGLDEKGELVKGGYLDSLFKSEAAKQEVKQYLLTGIATKQGVNQFQKGLRNLIEGTKEVEGAMVGYWRRYAFDQYAQVREVNNLHFAQELNLKYFVYQGGIIPTSRDFCKKKNGRVFSDQEALRDWPKDPDLIDKKTAASYRPLLERGRYNCRHFLMWISEERAKELKKRENGE